MLHHPCSMNTDLARRLENLIRMGTIDTVDHATNRCTVKTGTIITAPLPWLTMRAGTDKTWDPPTPGEQCCIFSPSGELATGFVMYGFYSDANPAPSDDPDLKIREYSDGAVISYNTASHKLNAVLPEGGTATITATGGITANGNTTINGNVTVNGTVFATKNISTLQNLSATMSITAQTGGISALGNISTAGDVKAGTISLKGHKHPYTDNGGAMTTGESTA